MELSGIPYRQLTRNRLISNAKALRRCSELLDLAKTHAADNPGQQAQLTELEALAYLRMKLLEQGINRRRAKDSAGEIRAVLDQGKEVMDRIRGLVAAIVAAEDVRRAQRANVVKQDAVWAEQAIIVGKTTALISITMHLAPIIPLPLMDC